MASAPSADKGYLPDVEDEKDMFLIRFTNGLTERAEEVVDTDGHYEVRFHGRTTRVRKQDVKEIGVPRASRRSRRMSKRLLIIFDVDGTLFQSHLVTVPAIQETFVAFGLRPPDHAAVLATFGIPVEVYEAWIESHGGAGRGRELVEATNRREIELIRTVGALYPGRARGSGRTQRSEPRAGSLFERISRLP